MIGTLFPNSTVYQVVAQLPAPWNVRDIILQHTLFLYFVRMYSVPEKEKMLAKLCSGESVTLTHIWKTTSKGRWSLRYCPCCYKEDTEQYGEPYWHTEHQIPLVTACSIHHCKLETISDENLRLSEAFYPLATISPIVAQEVPDYSTEILLAEIVASYLTLPLSVGPTENYNNLAQRLVNMGYGMIKKRKGITLDASKIYQDVLNLYGERLAKEVFGDEATAFVLNRIVEWNLTSPERYILLQGLAGLKTEEMFGEVPEPDPVFEVMKAMQKTGVTYGKKQVAEQLGVTSQQLDTLAYKYELTPFWEGAKSISSKEHLMKIYLSNQEWTEINAKAKALGFQYANHFVRFCVVKYLESEKRDENNE